MGFGARVFEVLKAACKGCKSGVEVGWNMGSSGSEFRVPKFGFLSGRFLLFLL